MIRQQYFMLSPSYSSQHLNMFSRMWECLQSAKHQHYLLAPDAGTNFLLLCVQPIQSIHLKLDLRPACSAMHIPLLVDCKAPL